MTHLASRCESVPVRGLRYRIRHWGPESAPRLIFLHGWMDSSPSFQLVVDALERPWHVIAPDWRGFGGSQYTNGPYWQFDWHADLDRIVDTYSPHEPVRLMAANPRLTKERADFLARNASRKRDDGQVEFGADPWHRIGTPNVLNLDEVMGYWRKIEAPTLLLIADEGNVARRFSDDPDELSERIGCFKNNKMQTIANSGHNLHHDQPECVARAIETFLARADQ